ncbi:MAG: serine/threonine-protein kinase [Burkholderiaceae bacterium]|nr:serine/threonine-protein kinase [Burkholderiaceae bacterium]
MSQPATLARLRAGELQGSTHLDLRGCGLTELPRQVLALADTLQTLDLSGNALHALPEDFDRLHRLQRLFASDNRFERLPPVLGRCAQLELIGFKANRIAELPDEALPPRLRWLILTDNALASLPEALGRRPRLQKLMLAGNRLRHLPASMGGLQSLELLRLAANDFQRAEDALPQALLDLPRLAWLAFGGNPFTAAQEARAERQAPAQAIRSIAWGELQLQQLLGSGASGHIHAALWQPPEPGAAAQSVALKLFKAAVTSDGLPASERAANLQAGAHAGLVPVLGRLLGHPAGLDGLVLQRLPEGVGPLAGPPSLDSCSRDVYAPGLRLAPALARSLAATTAAALAHLHGRGLLHGDLYAHNLLLAPDGSARLSDFGAASFLPDAADATLAEALRRIDRRALAVLVAELAERCDDAPGVWRAAGLPPP